MHDDSGKTVISIMHSDAGKTVVSMHSDAGKNCSQQA